MMTPNTSCRNLIRSGSVALAFCVALVAAPVTSGAVQSELQKNLASDGGNGNFYGRTIAINGIFTVVSAFRDDDFDSRSVVPSSVYVYLTSTGQEYQKFESPDPVAKGGHAFGFSLATDGAYVVVGAPYADGVVERCGAVYVFNALTGEFVNKLMAPDGERFDLFGSAVGIQGNQVIIGAPYNVNNGITTGAAYIMNLNTGQMAFKLGPTTETENCLFGTSIDADGGRVLIGAPIDWNPGTGWAGAGYLHEVITGSLIHKMLPDAYPSRLGASVALEGDTAVLGARNELDSEGTTGVGGVYVFDTTTGLKTNKFTGEGLNLEPLLNQRLGSAVSFSGNTAVVSAIESGGFDPNYAPATDAFLFDITTGQMLAELLPTDEMYNDTTGSSVAIFGDSVYVGGPHDDNANGVNAGAVYIFSAIVACPADINGDGITDTADLGQLIAAFGTANPASDINGDGVVDTADLGQLIAAFGTACP